jgi:hypothetical protein
MGEGAGAEAGETLAAGADERGASRIEASGKDGDARVSDRHAPPRVGV